MAADKQGGFSNPAMMDDENFDGGDPKAHGALAVNDGLCLRVDNLAMTHAPSAAGKVKSLSDTELNGLRENKGVADEETTEIDISGDLPAANIRRDRPFSASMISRKTTGSTLSHVSRSPSIRTTEYASKTLFAYRPDAFNKAVDDTVKLIIQPDRDGELKGSWLLTEVDHWNNDRERIVLLTEKSLLVVKFDFIKGNMIEAKQIPLQCMTRVQIGDLNYPAKSLMPNRDYGGIRIHFGSVDDVWFSQRWNPWSRAIPFITLTHHVLAYNPQETETVTYNADDMAESLVGALAAYRRGANEGEVEGADESSIVEDGPIIIESYASLLSVIFNQSRLGFYVERGGVSF